MCCVDGFLCIFRLGLLVVPGIGTGTTVWYGDTFVENYSSTRSSLILDGWLGVVGVPEP